MKPSYVGRTIKEVRAMTEIEMAMEGWSGAPPTTIVLDNGDRLYPSQDEEGNGPGALFGTTKRGKGFRFQ